MPRRTEQSTVESERRIRAFRENAAAYPHPGMGPKPDGKGPRGWRRKSPADETMTRGVNQWVATVKPDAPGKYMVSLRKFFDTRDAAYALVPTEWTALIMPVGGQFRLTLSYVVDDADEAMHLADEVMAAKPKPKTYVMHAEPGHYSKVLG